MRLIERFHKPENFDAVADGAADLGAGEPAQHVLIGVQRFTENRIVCSLIYWFHESHADWPARVIRVYSFHEYFCVSGHVWVEDYPFWRTLYRASGMVFPALKKLWDRGEAKLWPAKEKDTFQGGM